jgi:amidase
MVRERRISPVELVDAHFRQIAKHNTKINAFVSLFEAEAREAAKQAEAAVTRGETPGLLRCAGHREGQLRYGGPTNALR